MDRRAGGPSVSSSRGLGLLIVAGLLLVAVPATAVSQLNITAHDEGPPDSRGKRPFWMTVEGYEERNPTIELEPGEEVRVNFHNEGTQVHVLVFEEPIDVADLVVEPGDNLTANFTVPANATGTTQYVCGFHQMLGEGGAITFGEAPPPPEQLAMERDDLIPYPPKRLTEYAFVGGQMTPAVLTVVAALLMARRRGS